MPGCLPAAQFRDAGGFSDVCGTLHVNVKHDPIDGTITSVYELDVDSVSPAHGDASDSPNCGKMADHLSTMGAFALFLWAVWMIRNFIARSNRIVPGICRNCGYDLAPVRGGVPNAEHQILIGFSFPDGLIETREYMNEHGADDPSTVYNRRRRSNMGLAIRSEPLPLHMDDDGAVRVGNTRVTLDTIVGAHLMAQRRKILAQTISLCSPRGYLCRARILPAILRQSMLT